MKKFLHFLGSHPAITIILRKIAEVNFKAQKAIIKKYFLASKNESVIDIGCGTGEFSRFFSNEQYIGIDVDEKNIQYAKKHYLKSFIVADAKQLPFGDHVFDKVLIVGVLHHLGGEECEQVVREIKRVLKNGGKALIMEDTKSDSWIIQSMQSIDQGSYIRTFDAWRQLFQGHFDIEKEYTFKNGICFYSLFLLRHPVLESVSDGDVRTAV